MRSLVTLILITIALTAAVDHAAIQEFTNGNNLFTANFYKQISPRLNGNFLISPFSAEAVLAFAQSGCKGETAQEIRNALHLPNDKTKIENAIKSLIPSLKGNEFYTLRTANKMYVKEGFKIKDGFKKTATEVYHADIEGINFEQSGEAAEIINSWVEKQTNDKIQNLINPANLDETTIAILINAIYFNASWDKSFTQFFTRKENFYRSAKDVVEVDTMHLFKEWFDYFESAELKAKFLELPFKRKKASLVIVLPNEKQGLASLESQLGQVFTLHNFTKELVNIALPKFKIETLIELTDILKDLGIKKVFEKQEADISGIAGEKGDLVVSEAVQKTYIDVDETGVEAAAATYVDFVLNSALISPDDEAEPKEFVADHPFIFYIKVRNLIIFAGRVTNPS